MARRDVHSTYTKSSLPTFTSQGIEYTESLAGRSGALFHLWPDPGTPDETIQAAAKELYRSRDVVGAITWNYRPTDEPVSQLADSWEEREWEKLKTKIAEALNPKNRENFLSRPAPFQKQFAQEMIERGVITYNVRGTVQPTGSS